MPPGPMLKPARYRAWTWQAGSAASDLRLMELPLPPAGLGQVLVRNHVIGLNPVDWKVLGGMGGAWTAGHVPGVDGAGEVVELGQGVPAHWLGRRVAYHQDLRRDGSFAEFSVIDARALMQLPDPLSFAIAASFPCPALTAWQALSKLPRADGGRLLISGAGGAVGNYLVQLGVHYGWQVSTMSHPRHWPRLWALGAAECITGPVMPGTAALPEAYFDAAIDCVSAPHAALLAPALAANGQLVCIQGRLEHWPCAPFGRALSLHEVALGALHAHGDDRAWQALTSAGEHLLQSIAAGSLQPEPHHLHDFDALPQTLEALKHRNFSGKPLIQVSW